MKLYSERLIAKLEKKNIDLEKEIEAHKKTVEELKIAKEKAEESDRLKSAFLANMSHEIRTPVNGLIGLSELIAESDTTETERKEYSSLIHKSCMRLMDTISNILEISKIESKQVSLHNNEFNIYQVYIEIFNLNKDNFKKKGIEFILNFEEKLKDKRIISDETKLYQILLNLINNAYKFTNKGRVEFGCKLETDTIFIYVKDTGIGISTNSIDKVYDRFYQENTAMHNGFEGSGLGLSICKSYIDLLGGTIKIESEKDKGTTFNISLPVKFV